jgi:glycosyltransferase involved in cell wall biosynthesis
MKGARSIFINGGFTAQPLTGVQRYARELTRRLLERQGERPDAVKDIRLICPHRQQDGFIRRNLWEQVELLAESFRGILFSPSNLGPWLHPRHVVTIHDMRAYSGAHSDSLPPRTLRWHRASLQALSKTAAMICTDSYYSQKCIMEQFGLPEEKVRVIYPGADHVLDVEADESILGRLNLRPNEYVLAVGSLYPHKNIRILHSIAWEKYGLKLCIVGDAPNTKARAFQKIVDEAREERSGISYIGRRSDAEIRTLYAHALAYVFPSLYEGFGFPPLEAMYCRCPVIASDRTSIPEVCGDAALYFDPLSTESLQDVVERIVMDKALRESLAERGEQRAWEFRWELAADQVMHLLSEL